ncbi:MAG: 16S rRNA (cytidine(1402)-2'-O)-methyltransferase [SAR202 cluster bacterium Io17-Chloro-G9]|nr:MAG: 16S rRNA (cytidine(1402)-2'-O)-methyltransferase [SAR202 cluster bacterium Io17-Chloro-G9]
MGTLYIVGTPIGNLEDLTPRAARTLGLVDLVAAEDTRVTRRLLTHLGIRPRMVSYHQHNWQRRIPSLLEALANGHVALVTDAGMPGISDPGSELVSQVAAQGFEVEVVPGASSVTTALAISGLDADSFLFLGFLPRRAKQRRERLESIREAPDTLVIFEAPHRLSASVVAMLAALGDREVAVCRELTKLHQEIFRGTLSQARDHFSEPRGEFVLVVAGAAGPDVVSQSWRSAQNQEDATVKLAELKQEGVPARDAVATVGDALGLPRNTLYRIWLELP